MIVRSASLLLAIGIGVAAAATCCAQATSSDFNFAEALGQAQSLNAESRHQAAEQKLLELRRQLDAGRHHPSRSMKVARELAELYADAENFQKAVAEYELALRSARQVSRGEPADLALIGEVAAELADACGRAGMPDKKSQVVAAMRRTYAEHPKVAPATQLRFACLANDRREIARLRGELDKQHTRGRLSEGDFVAGCQCYADHAESIGDWNAVIATLASLQSAKLHNPDVVDRLSIAKQLADAYQASGDPERAIAVLQTAIAGAKPPAPRNGEPIEPRLIRWHLSVAHAELRLAELFTVKDPKLAAAAAQRAQRQLNKAVDLDAKTAGRSHQTAILTAQAAAALRLYESGEADSLAAAIDANERLFAVLQDSLLAADDRIATVQLTLGELYLRAEDYPACRRQLETGRAAALAGDAANYEQLGRIWRAWCELAISPAGKFEDAAILEEGIQLSDLHLPKQDLRLWLRLNLGRLMKRHGRFGEAQRQFESVLLLEKTQPTFAAARTAALVQLGALEAELMQFDRATERCLAALSARKQQFGEADRRVMPFQLAVGGVYAASHAAEDLKLSVDAAETLRTAARIPDDDRDALSIEDQRAIVHLLHDEVESSQDTRIKAREIWETLVQKYAQRGEPVAHARVLHYLARLDFLDSREPLRRQLDQRESAAASVDQVRQELKTLGAECDRKNLALQRLMGTLPHEGDFADRKQIYDKILQQHRDLQELHKQFHSLREKLPTSQPVALTIPPALERAAERAEQAADILRDEPQANLNLRYAALCNYARILQTRATITNDPSGVERAIAAMVAAIGLVEQPRQSIAGDVTRAEFFAQYLSGYDLLAQLRIDAYRQSGDDSHLLEAIVATERARARTLLDQLHSIDVDHRDRTLDVAQLRAMVDARRRAAEPVLYYIAGSHASYLFLLGGEQRRLELLPLLADEQALPLESLAKLVGEARAELTDQQAVRRSAREMPALSRAARVLLPKAAIDHMRAAAAARASHATIVPHGPLNQLPLEALLATAEDPVDQASLNLPLAYAPSLAVLAEVESRSSAKHVEFHATTLGNATFDAPLEALPASKLESDRVKRALHPMGPVDLLANDQATEARLRESLNRPTSILHLATHGEVGQADGMLFGRLRLTPPADRRQVDPIDDGMLELSEIYDLNLAGNSLTLLSACETNLAASAAKDERQRISAIVSLRREARSDPSFSLASAFLAAGATRVVATQWQVDDEATAEITATFVEKVAAAMREAGTGKDRETTLNYARLLAESKRQVRREHPEWNSPFYWSPLVLIGPASN